MKWHLNRYMKIVEQGSDFAFAHHLLYIASILFMNVNFTLIHT